MGARGKLKIAAGQPATEGTAAAEVEPQAPAKPASVADSEPLSALWDALVPELDRAGLLGPVDGPVVEMALRHFLLARQASDAVGEDAAVADPAHGGVKKNPAEAVFRAESEMFLKYAQQLGITFVARARTPSAGAKPEPNPFAPERLLT